MRQTTGFVRLPDGRRIAFAVAGSGPAVVLPAWWVSNVVEDWHFDPLRRFVEGLAAGRSMPRGRRGGGLELSINHSREAPMPLISVRLIENVFSAEQKNGSGRCQP